MKVYAVCFEPEDWLAFRENRRFNPSDRVKSIFPSPFPFYGALRTALLRSFGKKLHLDKPPQLSEAEKEIIGDSEDAGRLRLFGPFIFEKNQDGTKYYFPAPKNVYCVINQDGSTKYKTMPLMEFEKKVVLNENLKLDLPWRPEFDGADEPKESSIELTELEKLREGKEFKLSNPTNFSIENRFGIALENDSKKVKEEMLYTITYYRFKNGGFAMLTNDEETVNLISKIDVVFLGSKQRWARVYIDEFETDIFDPVEGRTAISLITPAVFKNGIAPDSGEIYGAPIKAIAGSKKVVISGWDVSRGRPKPIWHAVGPGTVYYLSKKPEPEKEGIGDRFIDFGFGRFVYMSWNTFKGGNTDGRN